MSIIFKNRNVPWILGSLGFGVLTCWSIYGNSWDRKHIYEKFSIFTQHYWLKLLLQDKKDKLKRHQTPPVLETRRERARRKATELESKGLSELETYAITAYENVRDSTFGIEGDDVSTKLEIIREWNHIKKEAVHGEKAKQNNQFIKKKVMFGMDDDQTEVLVEARYYNKDKNITEQAEEWSKPEEKNNRKWERRQSLDYSVRIEEKNSDISHEFYIEEVCSPFYINNGHSPIVK